MAEVRCWLLAIAACAGHSANEAAAPDAARRIATAERSWLAGDIDGAIAELVKAGGDRHAQALLARAYDIVGRPPDAQRMATLALAGAHGEPVIPRDVSKIDGIAISPDGAYVALMEWRYTLPPTVTVWNTLAGRVTFTTSGDIVAFGTTHSGEMLAVVFGHPLGMRGIVAATGEQRWSGELRYRPEVATDRRGTFTTIDTPLTLPVHWDLATGKKLDEIPIAAGSIAASADGSTVVIGTMVAAGALLDLRTTPPGRNVLGTTTSPSNIEDRSVAPDGSAVAVSSKDGTLELLGRDGRLRASLPHAGTHAQFLDDGTVIATDGRHVTRWTATGKPLSTFDLPPDMQVIGESLAIGAGGHAVVRRGSELVVLQLEATPPRVIARLGLVSRATALAWSRDGAQLGIANGQGDLTTWTAAHGLGPVYRANAPAKLLGFDAQGKLVVGPELEPGVAVAKPTYDEHAPPPRWRIAVKGNRVFERSDAGELQRFVEAPEELREAIRVRDVLVAAGVSGTVYAWNADTGAGLGSLAAGTPISALALGPDRRTLAVARETGGIELWDVGSRTQLASLVVADSRWAVLAPSGRSDGDARLLVRPVSDVVLPSDVTGSVERGLAARALAQLPPRIAIVPTPPRTMAPRGCLPKQLDRDAGHPTWVTLTGNVLSYCLEDQREADVPYCFAADLTTRAVVPIAAPLAVLAPDVEGSGDTTTATAERDVASGGIKACTRRDACVVLAAGKGDEIAISDDGALIAVGDRAQIETWDVTTGKRIARFPIAAWRGKDTGGERRPMFLGHTVLAVYNPCAGPCGHATMYSSHGKELGRFPLEASEPTTFRFHDDLWIATHSEFGGFAIIDASTGAVLQDLKGRDAMVATSSDRVAVVFGHDQLGNVLVYDRAGRQAAKVDTPHCP